MLNEPDLENYDLSSLRIVMSGGASCPLETIRDFQAKMKCEFTELYGMLETGFHTYTRPGDDPERVSGTCGLAQKSLGVRLIDEDGNDVGGGRGRRGRGQGADRSISAMPRTRRRTPRTLHRGRLVQDRRHGRVRRSGQT